MATNKPQIIQPVKVKSFTELQTALKPFLPGSQATIRKLLIDGFHYVRKQIDYREAQLKALQSAPDDGYPPIALTSNVDDMFTWVDRMIKERLDGKRTGMLISWTLPEGYFEFDPLAGELKAAQV